MLSILIVYTASADDREFVRNVSFQQVLELPFETPAEVIHYSQDDSQFIHWYPAVSHSSVVIINIHGGCWLSAFDVMHSNAAASALHKLGATVFNVEYRRSGNGGEWPNAYQDVQLAVNTIRARLQPHQTNVYLLGHSAGGHLAMRVASQLDWPELQIIGLAPIVDIAAYALGDNSCQSATSQFMQGLPAENPQAYQHATVITQAFDSVKPPIVLTGSQDNIVSAAFSYHDQAKIIEVSGAGHFDFIHPQTEAFDRLTQLLNLNNNEKNHD